MYIISKYKDYYDGVVGTVGVDKTIVYERFPKGLGDDELPVPFKFKRRRSFTERNPFRDLSFTPIKKYNYDKIHSFIVGFCGKLYIGWRLHYKVKEYDYVLRNWVDVDKYDIVYGYDNVKKFVKERLYSNRRNIDDVKQILDYDPIEVFRELNAPIFVFNHSRDGMVTVEDCNKLFVVNPILKEYGFFKAVDAFTAFTELQMFIGGVLGIGEKEIIEVEDKYKISQHGFDKHSFRKEPGQKKKRK